MTATSARPAKVAKAPRVSTFSVLVAVLGHHLRRTPWSGSVLSALMTPTMYLLAIGVGLGSQIDDARLAQLGADSYAAWIGSAMLVSSAMMVGAAEGMWPTMAMVRWMGVYKAILYTPIGSGRLAIAHLLWIGLRAVIPATCYLVVLIVAGLVSSWWCVALLPLAALIAIAHGAPLVALGVVIDEDYLFPLILRVGVFPLFLFSGAFFPIDDLPRVAATIARVLPLWHGVEASRDLGSGAVDSVTLGHGAVVAAWAAGAMVVGAVVFSRRVEP